VLGRHVPNMRFLNVLLGDEPVLSPEVHYYQRLLASDHDEARQVLKGHLKEKSLEELYDSVLIPALTMAEQDRQRNDLDEETATFVYQSTREFVEDLSEKGAKELAGSASSGAKGPSAKGARVICVPASGEADEIAGVMLAQLLGIAGHDVECVSVWPVEEVLVQVEHAEASIIFISAIPPLALTHARAIYERLRAQFPSQTIVVGLWNYSGDAARSASRIDTPERVQVVTTLAQAVVQLRTLGDLAARALEQSQQQPLAVPSVRASE
jgi:hypothetical protein